MIMNVTLIVPPAVDWNMPLIALPLLKAYLPSEWKIKIIDLNSKLFSSQFGGADLTLLKETVVDAIEHNDLESAVDTYLAIEQYLSKKEIGTSILSGRSLRIIDEWFNSNEVYKYLQKKELLYYVLMDLLEQNINQNPVDVFGVSISIEEQIVPSFILCSILRLKYPNSKIILGGNIISRISENLLKSKLNEYFDLLITGEGEGVLQTAIEYITSPNIEHKQVFTNSNSDYDRDWFQNLKTPDFSDVCWNEYLSPIKVLPITVQRKCKWGKCDFCAIHVCWNHGNRERPVNDVVSEIEELIRQYNVKFFRIVDEMVSADYLYNFSMLLLKKGISIYYEAYVRFEEHFLNQSFMKIIFEGGCRQLFWGLENINDTALKFMNKGITKSLIDGCLQVSKNVGITNYCFVLMGIPQISVDTEIETINYISNNNNIHVGIVGSFVVDRLSPIHVSKKMQTKYSISLFNIGDLTTEIGYLQNSTDIREVNKSRTASYIKSLYSARADYALCSLLSEEARMILTTIFGNGFARDYIAKISESKKNSLISRSTAHLIDERVSRRQGAI